MDQLQTVIGAATFRSLSSSTHILPKTFWPELNRLAPVHLGMPAKRPKLQTHSSLSSVQPDTEIQGALYIKPEDRPLVKMEEMFSNVQAVMCARTENMHREGKTMKTEDYQPSTKIEDMFFDVQAKMGARGAQQSLLGEREQKEINREENETGIIALGLKLDPVNVHMPPPPPSNRPYAGTDLPHLYSPNFNSYYLSGAQSADPFSWTNPRALLVDPLFAPPRKTRRGVRAGRMKQARRLLRAGRQAALRGLVTTEAGLSDSAATFTLAPEVNEPLVIGESGTSQSALEESQSSTGVVRKRKKAWNPGWAHGASAPAFARRASSGFERIMRGHNGGGTV